MWRFESSNPVYRFFWDQWKYPLLITAAAILADQAFGISGKMRERGIFYVNELPSSKADAEAFKG